MYTAKEAREKSEKNYIDKTNKILADVFSEIDKAVANGEQSVTVYYYMPTIVTEKLEEMGYCIKKYTWRNEISVEIRWDK